MSLQDQPTTPFAGDELTTFFPWQGPEGREYIDVQKLSSCLIRRLTRLGNDAVIIGVDEDEEGIYIDFAPSPEAYIDLALAQS